jgi:hypothetical protein
MRLEKLAGETFEEAKEELKACLDALSRSDEWLAAHPVELEWVGGKWMVCSMTPAICWHRRFKYFRRLIKK